jgi:hypothetical protein
MLPHIGPEFVEALLDLFSSSPAVEKKTSTADLKLAAGAAEKAADDSTPSVISLD